MEGPISDDGNGTPMARDPLSTGTTNTKQPQEEEVNFSTRGVQHIRTTIPLPWAIALEHTIADLRLTKADALREAVALYLHYHGRGQGIPKPLPPMRRQ